VLSRRQLLARGIGLAPAAVLAGCSRGSGPSLLAVNGTLPKAWLATLPRPWRLQEVDATQAILAALSRGQAGTGLVQLSDGWATTLDRRQLQPFGAPELLARLNANAAAVSRLFGPAGQEPLAFPWAFSPWVLVLRSRPSLAARAQEGWDLLLDPSLAGRVVLPSSPRVTIALMERDPSRLRRLRAQALASDDRDGLRLLLSGPAQAAVVPRHRVVPLLRSDPRLKVVLPAQGGPLSWNLLLRPAGDGPVPAIDWLAEILEPPLLPRLLAAGWVPPLPRPLLQQALRGFPAAMADLLLPPASVQERWRDLPPLPAAERKALQQLWDAAAPPAG